MRMIRPWRELLSLDTSRDLPVLDLLMTKHGEIDDGENEVFKRIGIIKVQPNEEENVWSRHQRTDFNLFEITDISTRETYRRNSKDWFSLCQNLIKLQALNNYLPCEVKFSADNSR